jgi:hypothetical protein
VSRVEDDRDAARLAERIAAQKRAEESKKKESQAADSAFSRLVGGQQAEKKKGEKQATENQGVAKSAIARLLEKKDEGAEKAGHALEEHALLENDSSRDAASRMRGRTAVRAQDERAKAAKARDGSDGESLKLAEDRGDAAVAGQKRIEQADTARGSEGRSSDSKDGRDSADGKQAEKDGKALAAKGGRAREGGAIKADADKGGQGQGKKDDQGGNQNAMAAQNLRFNPALMAPPPVAQKNEKTGSDRLRRLATELAQKIVERVRVGTNAAGNAEFQIDLKDDVLKGLKMKVSSKNGRISAVFQGSDKDVLKMLSEQSEALKVALTGRGLTLDQFKVEYKA